jgi:uncharacterized membrane protein YfcA
MQIYLPIAEMSVNWLVIILLGGGVGFLSGMFGVGGGFLTTPLLIFYGIPPAVAVASAANQITGSSVSGAIAHWRRGAVDFKMGGVLIAGSLVGSLVGSFIFRALLVIGQLDLVVSLLYVVFLGGIGVLMLVEGTRALLRVKRGTPAPVPARRHEGLGYRLPWKMRFHKSRLYISAWLPLGLGFGIGLLTAIMGVGGGFLMIPAMIYLLGMAAIVVVGTSLFQIVFTTAATTILHAVQTQSVDIVLAILLLVGGVIGAQFGARAAQRLRGETLRILLALLVLGVAIRLAIGLTWQPPELYSVFEGL